MGNTITLDGLTTPQALAAVARRLDQMRDFELRLYAAELACRGLARAVIEQKLAECAQDFDEWRAEWMPEMEAWIRDRDSRLN
jgi:hypothetical protein